MISFRSYPNVALPRVESSYTYLNGVYCNVITTKWLDVQVRWNNQITDWVTLHTIKDLDSIEVAFFLLPIVLMMIQPSYYGS